MDERDGRVPEYQAAEGVSCLSDRQVMKLSGCRTISGHYSGEAALPKEQAV